MKLLDTMGRQYELTKTRLTQVVTKEDVEDYGESTEYSVTIRALKAAFKEASNNPEWNVSVDMEMRELPGRRILPALGATFDPAGREIGCARFPEKAWKQIKNAAEGKYGKVRAKAKRRAA